MVPPSSTPQPQQEVKQSTPVVATQTQKAYQPQAAQSTTSTVAATPRPRPTVSASSGRGHISILNCMKEKEVADVKKEEMLANIASCNKFTQEDMIRVWNKYMLDIQEKQILKNTMETCKPTLTDNYVLVQVVSNSFQEKEMLNEKLSILNFMRVELKNGNIDLQIQLSEVVENSKIMTPNEKFKKMMEEKPALALLQEKFKLELEIK